MPDPNARKRLKKRMLDRWENEGGRIATDTSSPAATTSTSEGKRPSKGTSAPRKSAKVGASAAPEKDHKPRRK
jgi:hypothetical protein